jgi:hypothetical protein
MRSVPPNADYARERRWICGTRKVSQSQVACARRTMVSYCRACRFPSPRFGCEFFPSQHCKNAPASGSPAPSRKKGKSGMASRASTIPRAQTPLIHRKAMLALFGLFLGTATLRLGSRYSHFFCRGPSLLASSRSSIPEFAWFICPAMPKACPKCNFLRIPLSCRSPFRFATLLEPLKLVQRKA